MRKPRIVIPQYLLQWLRTSQLLLHVVIPQQGLRTSQLLMMYPTSNLLLLLCWLPLCQGWTLLTPPSMSTLIGLLHASKSILIATIYVMTSYPVALEHHGAVLQ